MYVLLFMHIVTMFSAVAVAAGSSVLVLIGARRGDRVLVAAVTSVPVPRVAPIHYILGGLFGVETALAFGFNLLSPWLVIAYLLFAMLAALGIACSGQVFARCTWRRLRRAERRGIPRADGALPDRLDRDLHRHRVHCRGRRIVKRLRRQLEVRG